LLALIPSLFVGLLHFCAVLPGLVLACGTCGTHHQLQLQRAGALVEGHHAAGEAWLAAWVKHKQKMSQYHHQQQQQQNPGCVLQETLLQTCLSAHVQLAGYCHDRCCYAAQVGLLSSKTRLVRVKNVLTEQEDTMEVPSEETVGQVRAGRLERSSSSTVSEQ
jgi:hypothetical protein